MKFQAMNGFLGLEWVFARAQPELEWALNGF
jgi:hypothetical protein